MTADHGPGEWKRDPEPDDGPVIDMDRGMSAPHDWLAAASDPRVVVVNLARLTRRWQTPTVQAGALSDYLRMVGITATEDQARALLDAVAAWDAERWGANRYASLADAVTAIVDRGAVVDHETGTPRA